MIPIPEIKISVTFDKKIKKSDLITINSINDITKLLRNIFNKDTFSWTEELIILCLNQGNKVIGFSKISSGGFSGTIADPRVILTIALNCAASYLILAHNHPSGNANPSNCDKEVTNKIKEAAKLLDIKLLDHIILTDDDFYSFAKEGEI